MAFSAARNVAITLCISRSLSTHLPLQLSLIISSCLARSYKVISKVMTVFLSGPMIIKLISCVCFRTVISVRYSWAGELSKAGHYLLSKGFQRPGERCRMLWYFTPPPCWGAGCSRSCMFREPSRTAAVTECCAPLGAWLSMLWLSYGWCPFTWRSPGTTWSSGGMLSMT